MIIFENLIVEFKKLNSNLERIQEQNEKGNDYLHDIAFNIEDIAKRVLSLEHTFDMGRMITMEQHIESMRDNLSRSLIEIEGQLQAIEAGRNKSSFQNVWELDLINEKLSSIVNYMGSQSCCDDDDEDIKKNN